jgi:predicted ATPase/DNA-binding CsgD family transcriptional regulator
MRPHPAPLGDETPKGSYNRVVGATNTRAHSPPDNLAVELSSFVGRAHELVEIRRLLAISHTVTLTGPGGIGKSRLGLRVAHQLGRHFPNGVWWVELSELDAGDLVVHATAQALGVSEQPGVAIDDALVSYLRERRLLLVLDNCEHLASACRELVLAIVSRCDGVRVLCTSRQRLGVPGEAIVVVSPLEVPVPGGDASITTLGGVDALNLLVDRARTVAPDFALTEDNAGAVSDICRRLDGLPLAIELAAVRLASLSPGDLLLRLDDRFRLLTTERKQHSRRNQALRATVEWSYELLGEAEQILWRRLSVFAGSFGIEAAEAVCSGDGVERDRIVDLIANLVERSIVTMRQGDRRGRYRLLETLRLYGTQRLREADEEIELRRRHAAWFVEVISGDEDPWWTTGGHADLVDALDLDWANIEAALDFCAGSAGDTQMGLRMASDLWIYWMVRGRYRLGLGHLERFLALEPTPTPIRAFALWTLGWMAQATGDHDIALAAFEDARRLAEETGADRALVYALMGLGVIGLRRREPTALELLVEALEAVDRVDDPIGRDLVIYFYATALTVGGKLVEASALVREGLAVSEPFGDTMIHGLLSALSGIVDWQLGDADAAERSLIDAVRIQDRMGHLWSLAVSLDGLAWVAASSGHLEQAALLLGAVASLWEQLAIVPVPFWQGFHDQCQTSVRAGLDEAHYLASYERGFALDRRQQAALALDDAVSTSARTDPPSGSALELTARELEVARLVADGLSNRAISSTLFISVATVKTHVSHILQKLALDSRVQLARWAASRDLSSPALPEGR